MVGFLVRAAIGGAVAYGVLTVLDKTKALEKVTALSSHVMDKVAEKLVHLEGAVAANGSRPNGHGGGMS